MGTPADAAALMASQMQEDAPRGTPPPPTPSTPSAPVGLPPVEQFNGDYLRHREQLEGRAALSSQLSEDRPVQTTAGALPGAPGAAQGAPGAAAPGAAATPAPGGSFADQIDALRDQRILEVGAKVRPVAADLGRGLLEAPKQALVGGPRDAFQAMIDGAADLGTWMEKAGDLPGIKYNIPGLPGYDPKQSAGLSVVSDAELQKLHRPLAGTELPSVGEPKTVTGGVFRAAGEFVTSMATLGRVFGPMGTDAEGWLGHLAKMGKSGLAMFSGFEGAQGNLANLIEKVPALKNPVTEFLAAKPDDNEALARLKNAIAGVGFGELQDGIIKGLGFLRSALTAKTQLAELPAAPAAQPAPKFETPAAFKFLGNPDATAEEPLASIGVPRGTLEAGKAAGAAEATAGLKPEDVAHTTVPVTHEVDELGNHTVKTANGEITASEKGGFLQVSRSDVAEAARGQGEGISMMERLAAEADSRNLKLASDVSVSADAERLYEGLERRGYAVTRNPAEVNPETGNLVSADPRKPVFEVGMGANAKPPEGQVYINFARIDTPDDVKRTMQQLADAQKGNIDYAKRGIQTFEDTKFGADLEDAWRTLMDRRIGEALNDRQLLAGRQLLAQSAIKAEALTRMTSLDPSTENLFAWRKQMITHAMIQAEISGAITESARATGSLRIPVSGQGAIDRMAAITQQLDHMGGVRSNLDFLRATQSLFESGRLEDLGNVAERTLYARTRDALLTGWTNGLLTAPLTHIKVNLSNIATIAQRLMETRAAEAIGGVEHGETAQTMVGLIGGIKDSLRYLGKVSGLTESEAYDPTTGESVGYRDLVQPPSQTSPLEYAGRAYRSGHYSVGAEGGVDWAQPGQDSAHALSVADSGWLGKATDLMSSAVTSPGRALAGEHEFYRAIGMRMELQRFAFRQAMDELNSGKIPEDALAGRIAQLVENPPAHITADAVSGMTYQTFTDAPGKFAEQIGNLREQFPLVRVILPFYKIPSRIFMFGMERTPLAPLMAGWRADIAAGGARQSLALAKAGIGSMLMLAASDAVLNGTLTGQGPKDKTQRQALLDSGWLPYSGKPLGSDRWIQYNRLESVGSTMAMAADMTEAIRDYYSAVNTDDPNVEKISAAGIATLANAVTSKTYFEGVSRFFEVMNDPRAAEGALKGLAGSFVPAGVGAVERLTDPYQRATYSMIDALRARTPGLSKDLPPVMNRWGEPVRVDSGLGKAYDAFVPFASRRPGSEPIDKELLEQGMHLPTPEAKASFGRGALVDLRRDPAAYARYLQLAGNELKLPGPGGEIGLKDRLNALVTGKDPMSSLYDMLQGGTDGGKEYMLRGIAEQYNRAARDKLLDESKALGALVEAAQDRHAALRAFAQEPAAGGSP
jgi:hypothetical protein